MTRNVIEKDAPPEGGALRPGTVWDPGRKNYFLVFLCSLWLLGLVCR